MREFWILGGEAYSSEQDTGILRAPEQIHVREVNPEYDAAVEGFFQAASNVIRAGIDARLSMTDLKIVSMGNSEFRQMRNLGFAIEDLKNKLEAFEKVVSSDPKGKKAAK